MYFGSSHFRQISLPGVNALLPAFTPLHATALQFRILSTPLHPLHDKYKIRLENRSDTLWWSCIVSNRIGGNKKTVRGWLARRAKAAFRNALKKKGYDEGGARLRKDSGNSTGGDLFGSAQLYILSELAVTNWTDLCHQADLIVAAIEKQQGQSYFPNRKDKRAAAFKASKIEAVKSRLTST